MLGQATARLEPAPRRWLQQLWGYPYLHARQDWRVIWPQLRMLPANGIRLLDAGCGAGRWALELARRRPGWSIVGLDWDRPALGRAEMARRRLGLANLAFVRSNFAEPGTGPVFDVLLSVCSAHYVTDPVAATGLFTALASCLRAGGRLLLYGPRCIGEAPFVGWLRRPVWHQVYSAGQLRALCQAAGLRVDSLAGRIGRAGTLAKQLDWQWQGDRRRAALAAGLYWVELALAAADRAPVDGDTMHTLMWLLVASKE